ncbi:hypothetical protein [Pyxidicoccus trucidator]|uniref:hypothetical protein n=1 Tax=Pyxidicoccus trucidator TaxID=2709662 RepID=UPI0013DBFFE4|nr:hypothetical protein [Pyxidicoccus trucidator]
MARLVFVTFDLTMENQDYKTAYQLLGKMGLYVKEPEGKIALPNTSVMGRVPDGWSADFLRQRITDQFRAAGVNLSQIFCAVVSDYAGMGKAE